jgi:pseudouridine kinase
MERIIPSSSDSPVLVIGAAGVDLVGRLKVDLQRATSNPSQIRSSFGGVARNVAENLSRLGQRVSLLTALGQDEMGEHLIQQIQSAGVDTQSVLISKEWPTGTYLAVINQKGELQFALDDMRAISAITSEYLHTRKDLFENASLLFIDANVPKAALRTAISLAKKYHIPICADPTSVSLAHKLIPHLAKLSLITPNSAEASILCGREINPANRQDTLDAAKCLVSQGVDIAIITLAKFGLCYATSETNGYIPAIRTEIVDPTGGGDALIAAVIFGLLNDIPIDDAIALGLSAATLTLRYPGSVIPNLSLEMLYDQLVI